LDGEKSHVLGIRRAPSFLPAQVGTVGANNMTDDIGDHPRATTGDRAGRTAAEDRLHGAAETPLPSRPGRGRNLPDGETLRPLQDGRRRE
jgi:hypothetical protein